MKTTGLLVGALLAGLCIAIYFFNGNGLGDRAFDRATATPVLADSVALHSHKVSHDLGRSVGASVSEAKNGLKIDSTHDSADSPAAKRDVSSVAAILNSQDLADSWMVMQFLNLTQNQKLDGESRLRALNEALNRIQLGEEAVLLNLARGAGLSFAMVTRLSEEAEERSIDYRFDLHLLFLSYADENIRQAARDKLTLLLDQDYGPYASNWFHPGIQAKRVWAEH